MDERVDGGSAAGGTGGDDRQGQDPTASGDDGVLTVVCVKCGTEYYYGDEQPPEDLTCEKCGNTVFRSFFSHETEDEVETDFRDSTERDLHPDDPEGATMPGDLLDLDPERS